MDDIVITGMGVVSPLGSDIETFEKNLFEGISGAETIDALKELPVKFGCPAIGFNPSKYMTPKELRHLDRYSQFAIVCGLDAAGQAQIKKHDYPEDRIGVLVGSGAGGLLSIEEQLRIFDARGPGRISPLAVPMFIANMASGVLAKQISAKGPGMGVVSACASAGHALALAHRLIKYGDADCMLAGGVEACLTPFCVSGFAAMRALSTRNDDPKRASRPFDKDRDGFVMGEGGGVFVLEKKQAAIKRGAKILAVLKGAGMSQDAYHMVAPDPEATAVVYAINAALKDSGITPEEIDYINTHGTSTQLNDKTETLAIKKAFGERAGKLYISSTKSMTGHLIGGAAAIESAACILAMQKSLAPPTINLDNPDPECDLNYVPNKPVKADIKYCMKNAFGFAGQNVSLVFERSDV